MKKKLFALLMVFVMVFSLAACSGGDDSKGNEGAARIVIADDEWYGTDMYQQDTWSSVQSLISDTIFAIDPKTGALIDGICTNLQVSEDGLTMTMEVPEGRKFANGADLDAGDIKASIEWGHEVGVYADGFSNIESIDVDGTKVIFHLSTFRSDLLYYLGECFMGVIDSEQLETMTKDELMWGAIPYGPYYVESYETASNVTLKANPYYKTYVPLVENQGAMPVEEIFVKFNTEDFTAIEELKSGKIDYWSGVTPDAIKQLEGVEGVIIKDKTYPEIGFMEINTSESSIFNDVRLRQALCLALDREAMCELTDGASRPAYSMIIDSMLYYDEDAATHFKANYANNMDKAIKLLEEAGWVDTDNDGIRDKDGQKLEFGMYASTDSTRQIIVQGMQEQLRAIGMQMNAEAIDWNYVHEYLYADDYDLGIHSLGWMEPILIFNSCFDDKDAANNTPEYLDKVNAVASTVDDAERSVKLGELQINDLYPEWNMIPMYSPMNYIAHSERLQGVNILQNSFIYWNDLNVAQ
ncbi:MAG: ABC transporter substrate-binding protein [Candidatus Cloacimonetes bacterium]|nr:ABC transporter substrate-binding protein [Candidatus Cloacimonadota bacterium]